MKKTILALALWLLASSAAAQQGFYCGHTGFSNNTGASASSFRCAPQLVTRGSGTLTLNGTSTITVANGSFAGIVKPDALPGADGIYFNTSGILVTISGRTFWYRVSAKASDSSITVLKGLAAPAETGTTTNWSYWNTTCYRSGTVALAITDIGTFDPRVWSGSLNGFYFETDAGDTSRVNGNVFSFTPANGTGSTPWNLLQRPAGLIGHQFTNAVATTTPSLVANEYAVSNTQTLTQVMANSEYQFSMVSSGSDNFWVICAWRGR